MLSGSLIEELLPQRTGRRGRPFSDARVMIHGIVYRYRCRIAWRDLPPVFGPPGTGGWSGDRAPGQMLYMPSGRCASTQATSALRMLGVVDRAGHAASSAARARPP
ncbi:transposase [Cellulomonas sp. GX59]|uniref:transposase n=1 Tax=Cellulomonas sp. SLBN-39 TaxID=2768446 RepID=UPI00115449E2